MMGRAVLTEGITNKGLFGIWRMDRTFRKVMAA